MNETKHLWMIRAGHNNDLAPLVYTKRAIALGYPLVGDLRTFQSTDDLIGAYLTAYPVSSPGRARAHVVQLFKFYRGITTGDNVISYIKQNDEYLLGVIATDYVHDPTVFSDQYPHVRFVQWESAIPSDSLSQQAKRALGTPSTIFSLDHHAEEIYRLAKA